MLVTSSPVHEQHFITRIGWLRAAVVGANYVILSTASVIVGAAAANPGAHTVLLSGIAALTAGAISMAAGEYVSVSSQTDTEAADLAREAEEQRIDPRGEPRELAAIYINRGLSATGERGRRRADGEGRARCACAR